MMARRWSIWLLLCMGILGGTGLASAATTVNSAANPNANGLPSGGNTGDCVLNTAPGVGSWGTCPGAGTGAPTTVGYWVDQANATLTAERNLGALTTGLVLNTVTTGVGVPSAYPGTSCTNQVLRILSASGVGTCSTITSAFVDSSILISGGALGTPLSGTLTNATGLPISTGVSGLGTGVATFLGTPSSANLAAAVTGETGSGAVVFGTAPTIDASVLTTSVRLPNGTTVPGTCSIGMIYFDNDAPAGTNLYGCTSANTWSLLGDGGGAGVTDGDKGDITVSGSGATWTIDAAAKTHALLDPIHTDTVAGAPVVGDLLMADSGNLWSSLGGPTSASERCLYSTGTGTAANPPYWGPCSEVKSITGTTYTILASDNHKLLAFSNASSTEVTLSQATTAGFGNSLYFYAKAVGAGTATITPTTSTINGAASLALAPNEGAIIWSNGTNYEALRLGASSSGSSSPALNSTTFIVEEEFCSGLNSAGNIGSNGLYNASGTASYTAPVTSHPCILNMATGASAGNLARVFFSPNDANPSVLGDIQAMRFIIRPQSLDADTSIRCGFLVSTATTLEGSDGVYASYLNSASANWRAATRVTSLTATNSSVAAGSGTWVQLDIVRNGSNWDFSINEASAFATPATSTGPSSSTAGKIGCVIETAAAAAKNIDYDYFGWTTLSPLAARHP